MKKEMEYLSKIEKRIYKKLLKQQEIRSLNKIESFRLEQYRKKLISNR